MKINDQQLLVLLDILRRTTHVDLADHSFGYSLKDRVRLYQEILDQQSEELVDTEMVSKTKEPAKEKRDGQLRGSPS